ncbi:uncharacterized protein OCT59_028827 [Rhizophagus irregularis]|uniref:uncharacterized protein n=1 Tax=Rhizophagus irregularis TaxID=588596 RepID=UPI0019EA6FF7|nr:hypothetical protein OCT59_028827 [Rhizophagus irregularis]GBC52522.2 hypothetical protein GLOIN_2v1531010 [Rhizophagus irregularis DAOM 181602=DAOM 197198]
MVGRVNVCPYRSLREISLSLFNTLFACLPNESKKVLYNDEISISTSLNPIPLKNKISFPCFPGMKNLSELHCESSLSSDFFHQLSQKCHNIESISILLDNDVSNEVKELIS